MRRSAAGTGLKRFVAAALLCGSALTLGACAGSVADMWPHWAGGEPAGLPPRPGQPGYDEFIAHGKSSQNPAAAPVAQQAPAGTAATIAEQKSAAQAQRPPAYADPQVQDKNDTEPLPEPAERPASDSGVVHGGLY